MSDSLLCEHLQEEVAPKWVISLEKVPEKLLAFHESLVADGWRCFAPNTYCANEHWVKEFCTNVSVMSISDPIMRIQGKEVYFRAEQINDVYGLPDIDKIDY